MSDDDICSWFRARFFVVMLAPDRSVKVLRGMHSMHFPSCSDAYDYFEPCLEFNSSPKTPF